MTVSPPAEQAEGGSGMSVINVGCGRVGSTLAVQLVVESHDVRLIYRSAKTSRLLAAGFPGRFHEGNAYSRGSPASARLRARSSSSQQCMTAGEALQDIRR